LYEELRLPLFPPDWLLEESKPEGEARGVVVIDLNPEREEEDG
jgi:hypothetical protein